jgi:hypothetical protein
MAESWQLWVPTIGAALVGTALFVYATEITRRFDKRVREAQAKSVEGAQPAKKLEQKKTSATVVASSTNAEPKNQEATMIATAGSPSPTRPPARP